MEEFKCKYSQTQPRVAMLTTTTKKTTFWVIFGIDKNKKIRVVWQNKG